MTRFIQFCDAYGIPMLFVADNPGLMVGVDSEQAGMIREASDLLRALAVCKTPRACLVIRKAYTVGLYAMSGSGFDPAYFWAAPNASISVFGPKALDYFAKDRELSPPALEAIHEMLHHAVHPHDYEKKGYLSGVIQWNDLRSKIEQFVIANPC
jgi:acetyl-CoA carboxylase carboxyltransferase component